MGSLHRLADRSQARERLLFLFVEVLEFRMPLNRQWRPPKIMFGVLSLDPLIVREALHF